jgi:tetratricopeptide (TPR) repeat protein
MPLSVGDRLMRYEIRGFLGAGGMGEVYRAHDPRLGRDVAIKVLPEHLTDDRDRLQRFEREARAAAALSHPNILDVHDIGEHEGRTFIVTELLEGESLRSVVASGRLSLSVTIDYARQIAGGLTAAHDSGITHRDLKPANLFLTGEGRVKILDFGLAKLARPETDTASLSRSPTKSLQTEIGVAMGTPGYIAPEQLQGRRADQRADIFSFGVVLYEMITGEHPFPGATTAEIQGAILNKKAPPASRLNPDVPMQLEQLVERCLEKNPEHRYQSARELQLALAELSAGQTTSARLTPGYRLVRRGSMAAIAAIVVVLAIVLFQRPSLGVPFRERDWLLITDVANLTGDPTFDHALDPALTVAVEQSSYVNVLSRGSMLPVLRQMKRPDAIAIDEDLGREIARRRGIDVILVPSVSRLGERYALTASLKSAVHGTTYASRIVYADGIDQVLPSLDTLCREVRADLGEALGSISERSKPLIEATTHSFEALQQYSLAYERHLASDPEGAMTHYEAALRVDPDFTTAKAALGILHLDWGHMLELADPEKGRSLLSDAAAGVGPLTENERLRILSQYAQFVERDLEHAAELLRTLLSIYPDRADARHNLALIYDRLGRPGDAIKEFERAIASDPNLIVAYNGLVRLLRNRYGTVDAIIEWATRELEITDDQPWPHLNLCWAHIGRGDGAAAVAAARRALEIEPDNVWCHYHLGHALKCAGDHRAAAGAFETVLKMRPTEPWANYHAGYVLMLAGEAEAARAHFAASRERFEALIAADPDDLIARLWLDFARIRLGEQPQAGLTAGHLEPSDPELDWTLAQLDAISGRPQEAIDRLERALANGAEDPIWVLCIPNLDALHDEPRYQELKRRTLGLPLPP